MLPSDCLHCLTVDFAHAPVAVRAAIVLQADEIRDLLCHAGRAGAPLLVLQCGTSLTLVSTRQQHVRTFRPVLAIVREHLLGLDGWRALPVKVSAGSDAGRQLLRHAIPSSRFEPEIRAFVRNLRAAANLSGTCGAFSTELGALVRMTEHAADRVWEETRLGRAGSSEAEAELESLAAERIVEEELVAWQSSYPALRSSIRPISDADIDLYAGEERQSMVRLRVAGVLSKLRSA